MNIALVFPPSTFLTAPMIWPPLGLFYLASQLEAQGHETEFFDLSVDTLPEDGDFDQLWMSTTSSQMFQVRKLAEQMKGWKRTKTVLGGAAPWANPQKIPFNLIVAGEADHPDTVRQILIDAESSNRNMLFPVMSKDLDWVLPPIRRWSKKYHAYMKDQDGNEYRMASLFVARGCPMSCAFCASGRKGVIWGSRVRYEPLWCVEEQIRESVELGFTGLAYYDDVFILNKKRTLKLLELNVKYNMPWRCFLRSDILCVRGGREYLQQMANAGLIEVFIGVESASNRIKRNIHKGTTIEQDTLVVTWCRELGITCKTSFVIGLPGESEGSMQQTRDWILQHRPDIVQISRLIPFIGTPLVDHPEEYDLTYETQPDESWFFRGNKDMGQSFVSTSNLSRERIDSFLSDLEEELIEEELSSYEH